MSVDTHSHHLWDVSRVRAPMADDQQPITFFCGGSRNFSTFIAPFDEVVVLDIDLETLQQRLDQRPKDEWVQAHPSDRIVRLHRTREDIPGTGVVIDATRPLKEVTDEILHHVHRENP